MLNTPEVSVEFISASVQISSKRLKLSAAIAFTASSIYRLGHLP